jgi:hypothetical protein
LPDANGSKISSDPPVMLTGTDAKFPDEALDTSTIFLSRM